MKKKKKQENFSAKKTQEQQRNENFGIISNRIAYYYKEVFNVEIVSLLYKKKIAENFKNTEKNKQINKLRGLVFDFYILIKDNNKKIFKYKLIKCSSNASNYVSDKENFNFVDNLYEFVDEKMSEYCNENYLKANAPRELALEILEKDKKINEDYKNWKIENYK